MASAEAQGRRGGGMSFVRVFGFLSGRRVPPLEVRGVEALLGDWCVEGLFDAGRLCGRGFEVVVRRGGGYVDCRGRRRGWSRFAVFSASAFSAAGPRESNEDSVVVAAGEVGGLRFAFSAVADGVGGLRGGGEASNYAVRSVLCHVLASLARDRRVDFPAVFSSIHRSLAEGGGATTLTAVLVFSDGSGVVANVGDSPACLVKGGDVYILSQSDRLGGRVISQALGRRLVEVHQSFFRAEAGDVVVVVSDGVSDVLGSGGVGKVASRLRAAWLIARRLVEEALGGGGRDNASAAVVVKLS